MLFIQLIGCNIKTVVITNKCYNHENKACITQSSMLHLINETNKGDIMNKTYIIMDWAYNELFNSEEFKSYEDAWDYIMEHDDSEDLGDYMVVEVE